MKIFFNTFIKIIAFLTAISVFFLIIFLIFFLNSSNDKYFTKINPENNSSNKLAILNLGGLIMSKPPGLISFRKINNQNAIFPEMINEYLIDLQRNEIKGLIIIIDSPGGSVSATYNIYKNIKKYRIKNNIPIFFYSKDLLASGAYWIALSGNKIFANYGALIGSIGVKGPDWIYYNDPSAISNGIFGTSVETKKEIKLYSNVAGKSKDILNPFRPPSEEEKIKLNNMIKNIYVDFVSDVSSSRKIEKNIIIDEIGAMIYESKQAKKNFLIDDIKDINQIIEEMVKELEIEDYSIISNNNNSIYNLINNFFNNNKINNKEIINANFCNNINNQLSAVSPKNYNKICIN